MSGFQIMLPGAGLMFGVLHAAGLCGSARRPHSAFALMGMLRLLVIGLGPTVAALLGGIMPAAGGWALGFLMGPGGAAIVSGPRATRREVDS